MLNVLPFIEQDAIFKIGQATPVRGDVPNPVKTFLCPSDPRGDISNAGVVYGDGATSYCGVIGSIQFGDTSVPAGAGGIFEISRDPKNSRQNIAKKTSIADITDGTSNTLMVGERPPSGPPGNWYWGAWFWGEYDTALATQSWMTQTGIPGIPLGDPRNCNPWQNPPKPDSYGPDNVNNWCAPNHFWSNHTGGANWVMGDGSVRFLPYSAVAVVQQMATRAGGEVVNDSGF
jgi:prepilin-type processing-associated H-X9-DG protein